MIGQMLQTVDDQTFAYSERAAQFVNADDKDRLKTYRSSDFSANRIFILL